MDEKLPRAILRVEKIHTFEKLDQVEAHNTRTIPAGTVQGAPAPVDWVNMTGSFRERAQQVLQETGATWGKGQILAVEVLLSASPEWWANASFEQKKEWIKIQLQFAVAKFGPGLISFIPHLDESTPHVQLVALPLYEAVAGIRGTKPSKPESIARRAEEEAKAPQVWRLSYDKMFGGHRDKLADLQTEYHGYVKHLGLARGEDTRGKGLRHKPLKECRRELQEQEKKLAEGWKLLDAAWAELAEEREVQNHYREEIRKQHEEVLRISNQNFFEELNNRAKATELRDREEGLVAREEELERRGTELDEREHILNTRDAELAGREACIAAQLTQQAEEREHLDQQSATIESEKASLTVRERAVEKREADIADREEAVTDRERELATTMTQIAILGRIITGNVKGTWNNTLHRPEIANDEELRESERKALSALMPAWLKEAMRLALGFAEKREKLRNRAKRAIQELSQRIASVAARESAADEAMRAAKATQTIADSRVNEADAKEADAAKRIREAVAAEKTAKDLTAQLAQTRQEIAAAELDAERVQARVRQLKADESAAVKGAQAAEARRNTAVDEAAAAEAKVATAKEEEAAVRAAIEPEKLELAAIREERASIEKEIDELKADREELIREKSSIVEERAAFEIEKDTHKRSVSVVTQIMESDLYARINGTLIEVFEADKAREKPTAKFDLEHYAKWVQPMIETYEKLLSSREEAERTRKLLGNRYKALAEQYPEKGPELARQAAEDRAAAAAIAAQNQQNGDGR